MYYRKKDSDTWHWVDECQHIARMRNRKDVVKRETKPRSGDLCNECKAKAKRK